MKKLFTYFSKTEWLLWCMSITVTILAFCLFDRRGYATLLASLVGETALIFIAKGNPIGQLLMIAFGTFYGVISFRCAYYGETLTYVGMTVPMSVFSLISWLKNPYKGNKAEVTINRLSAKEIAFALCLTPVVTFGFYYVLRAFGTANLATSTLSVATSFLAVYLTFRRSPFFSLAYALNDIVLIALWLFASIQDTTYVSVITCFSVFLINDLYCFLSWKKREKNQIQTTSSQSLVEE